MNFIKDQEWRYATKTFDASKKVSKAHINLIKRAIQLSVSSYGLQTYKVLIIENASIREQLKPVSWQQSQITDASHLIVFCNYTQVEPQVIDDYIDLTARIRGLDLESLKGYADFMKMKILEQPKADLFNWTKNQTYIALANLLSVCASLQIDACPMEGFEAAQYNEILGLKDKGLNASVIAAIGYRSAEDASQYWKKVRKPLEDLFEDL